MIDRNLQELWNEIRALKRQQDILKTQDRTWADVGWVRDGNTWTYVSSITFTVPGDWTLLFVKGLFIRYKQGGAYKYGYVVSSSYSGITLLTTVTVTGGTDYTLAVGAITDNWFSSAQVAAGFPYTFNTGTITWDTATIDSGAAGVQPTMGPSYFKIDGNVVTHFWSLGTANVVKNTLGNMITFTIPTTMPAVSATYMGSIPGVGSGFFRTYGRGMAIGLATGLLVAQCITPDASNIPDNQSLVNSSGVYSYIY